MNRSVRSLALGAVSLGAVAGLFGGPGRLPGVQAKARNDAGRVGTAAVPAKKLRIPLGKAEGDMIEPAAKGWEAVSSTRVLLNRTPRVYQTEKAKPAQPVTLDVRGVRTGKGVTFRLSWKDSTRNAPKAPPKREGEGGDAAKLYKRPTGETAAFADAAAVMVPQSPPAGEFPSLVMGDQHGPVRLYYWNASRGAETLTASGRARVERTVTSFRTRARYEGGHWTVTLEVPELGTPSPVAFAVWDGEVADRNGMKLFSIWYVLE
ncbi:MAG: hypothetical protein U0797_03270 [Gemmataceae bacterium]